MQHVLFYTILGIFLATAAVTLLGITKKIDIHREYLKPLFSALILELVAAIILLFGKTDFFGPSVKDFRESLPERFQSVEIEEAFVQIRSELKQYPELSKQVIQLETQKETINLDLTARKAELFALEKNFLVKMARLNDEIGNYGTSINFLYNPGDEKRALAMEVQEALSELGYYNGEIDGDPNRTHAALVNYQEMKGFEVTGFFSNATVVAMIMDHLGT